MSFPTIRKTYLVFDAGLVANATLATPTSRTLAVRIVAPLDSTILRLAAFAIITTGAVPFASTIWILARHVD